MLAIARALMMRPRLLLLDEPSLGLAPKIVREIFELLLQINARDGVAILVAEQNAKLVLSSSSRAYVLETGRVAVEGRSADLVDDERIRRSYLGY
jgi:branched-chain amino acid transport system ATP-binding protein